ncbi:hypothetical protein RND71_040775 [Anisodus tanguticus]|uniref:Uncharacterized protein n=1 Tax=Anisodus tanguticus TaxID=243964 RepID=A0AAE1QTG5_9SOLA|nr:hypothetical protein RND71_040775 [Anisodus tanguticus]
MADGEDRLSAISPSRTGVFKSRRSRTAEGRKTRILEGSSHELAYSTINCRRHSASIQEFGGVGDGKTLNTKAFQKAVNQLMHQMDAVLLASQELNQWPVIDPLPSYGHGRDAPGGRYISLIFGANLTDVIITGENGTIDGQGALCDIIIQGITIIAPVTSPDTDGIDPDSGDECIAVKSGWDEYGIKYGMPTSHLIIRRFTCISPSSAAIALGSEMYSRCDNSRHNSYQHRIGDKDQEWRNYGSHADTHWDPKALPEIKGINYRDVVDKNVSMAGQLEGISGDPFIGICLSNVTIGLAKMSKKYPWACTNIEGISSSVQPEPCKLLADQGSKKSGMCDFPTESLLRDNIKMQRCYYRLNY